MEQQKKCFVGNIPFKATEEDVADLFQEFDPEEVKLVTEKDTGVSRGFAFVTFRSAEDAQEAIKQLNETTWGNRTISVKLANPDRPRDRDRRGNGGRRDSMR